MQIRDLNRPESRAAAGLFSFSSRLRFLFALVLGLVSLIGVGWPRTALAFTPPPLEGPVTDVAHVLSSAEKSRIESKLYSLKANGGHELAVLIVPTLGGESVEDYAYATARAWGLGQKGKDDGVLLLVSTGERKIRIETGKGVGGDLTDVETARIIRDQIGPQLKKGAYGAGIEAGVDAISAKLGGPAMPGKVKAPSRRSSGAILVILPLVVLLVIVLVAWGVYKVITSAGRSGRGQGGGYSGGGYSGGGYSGSDWGSSGGGSDWSSGDSGGSSGGSDFGGGGGDFGGGGSSGDY
jgi:uncharacterized protein